MKIDQIMSKNVVTIPVSATIQDALLLMKETDIRHLPVVHGDRMVGLITERDVRGALVTSMIADVDVRDVMIKDPVTVSPETMLEDAARLVYHRKIGCLPVVDEHGKLKGIITVADMLAALIELMGLLSSSSRLDVILADRPESLQEACRVIQELDGRIISVSLTQLRRSQQIHLFRLEKTRLDPFVKGLEKAGHQVVSRMD